MNDLTDHWTPEHGEWLVENGAPMRKKPNPVYMHETTVDGMVDTNEGTLSYRAGDFIAYDPISGHVWPVAASYVAQHYEPITE